MQTSTYILVVVGILAAKCVGFLRDVIFASTFGASELTDIYFQIFSLASLVFTGVGGALSTLIIKKLNKPENAGLDNGRSFVASFLTKAGLIFLAITAGLYLLAGPLVNLLLPGLRDELHSEAVQIMYIMLPSCFFVTVAYIMSGVVQNSGAFFITSIMSLPYNLIIIASLLSPSPNIITVSLVTTLGWFLHIAVLLPAFLKKGYTPFGRMQKSSLPKDSSREVLYIFISSMMFQLVFMADKAAVSADSGAATTINYASNLFVTIASVFVVAMSNVSYPSICRHYESGDIEGLKDILRHIITVLLAIFVPFILTVCCFGTEIIAFLYQRGEFTAELSRITATLFCIYTFGIFGYVCQELFNKILYLDARYTYTVAGTLAVVLSKPVINLFANHLGGCVAVAVTTAVAFTAYAICILIAVRKTVGQYVNRALGKNVAKILLAALAAFTAYCALQLPSFSVFDSKFGFVFEIAICGAVYIIVLLASGFWKAIRKRPKNTEEKEPGPIEK